MTFIAATVSATAFPPSVASCAPLRAISSVTWLIFAFRSIEAFISSRAAVMASTLDESSPVPWESPCEAWETWLDAWLSASDPVRTSPMICESSPTRSACASRSRPTSSRPPCVTFTVRSPRASLRATPIASPIGIERERAMSQPRRPTANAMIPVTTASFRSSAE